MSQSKRRKTISLLLIFCLLLSCLPGGAIAQTTEAEPQASAAPISAVTPADTFQLDADCQILRYVDEAVFTAGNHVARLTEKETLDTYVFLNADGTQTVYYMDENVKFLDENGVAREKDITLTASTAGFTTARNNVGLSLPTNLAQGITLSYGGYDVNLIPENIAAATAVQQDGKIAYLNCYGKGTGLIYTPTLSGVKEDILLGEYTGVNSFSFLLNTDGLNMYQNEQGRWYLAQSANAAAKMEMADIVAYDANSRHSLGSITVTTITAGQQYRLTVTVDEDFLTAETTAYPVLIDPSITVSDNTHGANAIEDSTIYEGQPNLNTGTWQFNHAGYYDSTYGVGRTVVRLSSLLSNSIYQLVTASQIQSATFYLQEATGSANATVELYPMNSNSTWTETNVTWSTVGTYVNALEDSQQMGYSNTSAFDILNIVQSWKYNIYNGQCGFILRLQDETLTAKSFVGSEYSVANARPYVVVNYSLANETVNVDEGDTVTLSTVGISGTISWASSNASIATVNNGVVTGIKAGQVNITASVDGVLQKTFVVYVTMPDGEYLIKLKNYTHYLTPSDISYASNTSLKTSSRAANQVTGLAQIWYIYYLNNGYYTISTMYKDTLRLTGYDSYHPALSTSTTGNIHKWTIQYDQTGYVLQNAAYTDCTLTGSGTAGSLASLSDYDSSNTKQRWELLPTPAEGLMLLDSETGERRDSAAFTDHIPAELNAYNSFDDMGLDLHIFGESGVNYSITFSNTTLATHYQASELIYGEKAGQTTATISATIADTAYQLSFPLMVCNDFVAVKILYDNAYAERYTNYTSRIAYQTQKIKKQIADQLFIHVDILSVERFQSYADTCDYGYASYCDDSCGTCESTIVISADDIDYCDSHHKNVYNIVSRIPRYTPAKTLAYIGHNTCEATVEGMPCIPDPCYGLAYDVLGVAGIMDHTDTSSQDPIHSAMTSVHEFGHLLGAKDHYGGDYPTTKQVNTAAAEQGYGNNLFSDTCMYGTGRHSDEVIEQFILCTGCQMVLKGEMPFPVS